MLAAAVKYNMNRRRVLTLFLCLTLQFLAGADNGVDGISHVCVDCLRRVQPSPDQLCIPSKSKPNVELCGSFKMTEFFYFDCRNYMDAVPEKWDSWEKCYKDDECEEQCVMAYHNHYTSTCATAKGSPNQPLVCADYGQIHYGGASTCGQSNSGFREFIQNMTQLCGCETVNGNRTGHLQSCAVKHGDKVTLLAMLIVVSCLAFVFLVTSIIAIGLYCIKRQTPNSGGSRPDKRLAVPPPPLFGKARTRASAMSSEVINPAHRAVQVHVTTEVPVQDKSMQQVSEDFVYINMPIGVSLTNSPSLAGSTPMLNRVRAPIPAPR